MMRKYIIGILIGFCISFTVSAHAEVANMIGKVIEGAFPIQVNGNTLNSQAIVVEGTSYLPVRDFGDATGYDVKFDADLGIILTKTVTETHVSADPKAQKLIEFRKHSEDIQNQISELVSFIESYDRSLRNASNMIYFKEKDDAYHEAVKKRDDLITQRETIDAQIKELGK